MIEQYINHKFRELMETPWGEMPAFKLGIIDENGKILKTRNLLETPEEKSAYPSMFHALCWNLRSLMERCDNPKTIGHVVSTAFKLRGFCTDTSDMDIAAFDEMLNKEMESRGIAASVISEQPKYDSIEPGNYKVRGKSITIENALLPVDEYFGHPIYRIGKLTFTIEEITKEDAPVNAVGHGNIAGVSPGQEPPGKRGMYFHRNKKKTKELQRRMGKL